MKINIYAPVDGTIGKIEDLKDGVFSEKMLGDGFFIKADKDDKKIKNFYSPVEGKVALITDSKHALFFEVNPQVSVLMHIGLDTVKLDGKPFDLKVKIGDKVDSKKIIVDVDIDYINKSGLDDVCPITINAEGLDSGMYIFEFATKLEKVKKGDLIGAFVLVETEAVAKEEPKNVRDFFLGDGKYASLAKKINKLVGFNSNYDDVYNCMTRLRFKVRNKDIVEVDKIKKLTGIKGIIWNGNELQVIIGQDVYKVKEEVIKNNQALLNDFDLLSKPKLSPGKAFLSMFSGIMTKLIPILIGCGIIQAIIGLLQTKWSADSGSIMPSFSILDIMTYSDNMKGVSVAWVALFALGKTSTLFMGVAIAISASKYWDFDVVFGGAIGLIVSSPILFADGGNIVPKINGQGDGITGFGFGHEWVLWEIFKVKDVPEAIMDVPGQVSNMGKILEATMFNKMGQYTIMSGGVKIFAVMGSVRLAKAVHDWVKTWVNPLFELVTRPFITIMVAAGIGMFLFVPVWNIFESAFGVLMFYVAKIPGGIGVGIYTALWQVAVIFGIHGALGIVGMVQSFTALGYGIFTAGSSLSVYCQMGALIGLIIVTRNSGLKKQGLGMIPAAVMGITEPILYGINLPKKRPLIAGVISAFAVGCFAGTVNLTGRVSTGLGLFEIVGFFQVPVNDPTGEIGIGLGQLSSTTNGLMYLAAIALSIGISIPVSMLMYKERKSEKQGVKNIANKLIKVLAFENIDLSDKFKELSKELDSLFTKEEMNEIKKVEKQIQKYNKLISQKETLVTKEINEKDKLIKIGKKLINKNKDENLAKANEIMLKINNINYDEQIKELDKEILKAKSAIDNKTLDSILAAKNNALKIWVEEMMKISKTEIVSKDEVMNNFDNALESLRINYGILDSKDEIDLSLKLHYLKTQQKAKTV